MAKIEKLAFGAFANVFAQAGATVVEVVLGLTVRPIAFLTDYHLGELEETTAWEKVQGAFNTYYRHILFPCEH